MGSTLKSRKDPIISQILKGDPKKENNSSNKNLRSQARQAGTVSTKPTKLTISNCLEPSSPRCSMKPKGIDSPPTSPMTSKESNQKSN